MGIVTITPRQLLQRAKSITRRRKARSKSSSRAFPGLLLCSEVTSLKTTPTEDKTMEQLPKLTIFLVMLRTRSADVWWKRPWKGTTMVTCYTVAFLLERRRLIRLWRGTLCETIWKESIPCNFCEKTFRSRHAKAQHNSTYKKAFNF